VDLWWSGKHADHGGNLQVLTGPSGWPEWVAPVEPGSVHDLTAARRHVLPFLYPLAAREGIVTLTDKGYQGAGIGVIVPFKGANLRASRAGHRPDPRGGDCQGGSQKQPPGRRGDCGRRGRQSGGVHVMSGDCAPQRGGRRLEVHTNTPRGTA
jgi:hypothetical protein